MTSATQLPIETEDLTYLAGGEAILDGLDLAVQRGEIFAVMGRSGTGKTTLLRLIMGLIPPTSGCIRVNGVDIADLKDHDLDELRRNMGMVFQ
ncbi:MAG: ATP-binding cassette domain-containing protein, partial [Armatimonadota bacterium]|nr:ATP-binding cassette domain-containing protein [Armatimonadota bacterium]